MLFRLKNLALCLGALILFAAAAKAQTSIVEGKVIGADGNPVQGAIVKFERTDIKGHYEVKTDKKGHYGHYGLPLGTYNITCEMDGKVVDRINGVKTKLGDAIVQNFDVKKTVEDAKAMQKAMETGTLTKEQQRGMSKEQVEAMQKQVKEREAQLSKNKELNDSFNAGKAALDAKNYDEAITQFTKASTIDATQAVIFSQLAQAYEGAAQAKPAEAAGLRDKSYEAWKKAIEINPNDAAYYNNYALALGRGKKNDEAQAAIEKAAQIDPPNAGKYYFNLGAMLTNSGQTDPACNAFKKAIEVQPDYADAQYQYGICLTSKATVAADGKVTPPPGTVEAFQKYLELKPDGPNADSAKAMLASMSGAVSTKYTNPDAKKPASKKK
jgi:tetratricopeptide (TPR) repeat protein